MKKRTITTLLCAILSVILVFSFASCDAAKGEMMNGAMDREPEIGEDVKLEIGNSQIETEDGEYERKIIKTAHVTSETKDFDNAIKKVEELCKEANAYIESSSVRGVSYDVDKSGRNASFTIRVPAEKFDSLNEGLGNILNITSSSSNADEITSKYYDIKSRIEVLELQKESLQKMYDNYTDYSDVNSLISLQDKLFAVIEEIEAYKTQIRLYDDKVAYSTVNLSIYEVVDYTENKENDSFWQKLGTSFVDGWQVFLDIMTGIVTVLAFILPELVVAGAVITLIIVITKKRKKKEKKEPTPPSDNKDLENPYNKR